jgi:hypothetical protein
MRVVAGPTDTQGLAHDSHGEAILFQMRDYGIDLFQVPWLKMAKAFLERFGIDLSGGVGTYRYRGYRV